MKRNINKQALEGLNLDEEWQSQSPSNDYLPEEATISDATNDSKSSKRTKTPKESIIKLPVSAWGEADDYNDAFTQQILKVLRRTKVESGDTTVVLAYIKNTGDGEPWLKLSWYKDRNDQFVLDELYEKSSRALKNRIDEILNPFFVKLHKELKKLNTVTSLQFQAMIKDQLPVWFLNGCGFHLEYNGTQYIVPKSSKTMFIGYIIELLRNLASPVENIQYITNDESQKDNALHFYRLKPSKEHFAQAPCLNDYSPAWAKFLHNRFNNPNMDLLRLTHYIYGLMSAEYHSRQALALFDNGDSGKSTFASALAEILPGATQTEIPLKALCGEFMPSQIDGSRGLVIDEGQTLQAFFDGDFFKRVTGAPDDDTIHYANRKFKDHTPMRIGSIRFMFLSNSRLCIHDRAGLTRISPMFFKVNFGRKQDSSIIISGLKAEGEKFIQFCIDNETYYRNVTSKYNHWYCPLIEDNGNINILTDKQYDDWYNEIDNDLYFSEEDQQRPEMRKRLIDINMENCGQATTNPETGDVMVYGSLSDDIAKDKMQELLTEIFYEDPHEELSINELACFIYTQLKDTKSQHGDKLKEIGFKYTADTTANIITKTRAWKILKNNIETHFPNVKQIRKGTDRIRILIGIQLKTFSSKKFTNLYVNQFDE